MIKTFKFRLYPTKSQKRKLDFSFDECLIIYNQLLCIRKQAYEKDKTNISRFDTQLLVKDWKTERPQLENIHSQVLQEVCRRLDLAYKAFFKRVKQKQTAGFPRYQKDNFSIKYTQSGFAYTDGKLKLSKIGSVKMKVTRYFPSKIKNCIIKKSKTGKYYACLVCETEKQILPKTNKTIAFDLGIKSFLHTSENEIIENPKYLNRKLKQLQNYSNQYSRTKSIKHRARLNRLYEKITNQREDFLHKLSAKIVKENDIIIFEDLNIKNMMSSKTSLNRNISDVSWNSFTNKLIYKAENAGREVVKVNPANTSNTCSQCNIKHNIDLNTRILPCCSMDRDYNASINIKALGMQSLGL